MGGACHRQLLPQAALLLQGLSQLALQLLHLGQPCLGSCLLPHHLLPPLLHLGQPGLHTLLPLLPLPLSLPLCLRSLLELPPGLCLGRCQLGLTLCPPGVQPLLVGAHAAQVLLPQQVLLAVLPAAALQQLLLLQGQGHGM